MRVAFAAVAALVLLCSGGPAGTAQPAACDARAVFAAMRNALVPGDTRTGVTEASGEVRESGLTGVFRETLDRTTGRSHLNVETPPLRREVVFNGSVTWEKDRFGGVHRYDAAEAHAAAVTTAYLARHGFLERSSGGATIACMPGGAGGEATSDTLHITPAGGLSVDLRVDRATHLIDRSQMQRSWYTDVRRYDDYHLVSGARYPYHVVEEGSGPSDATEFRIRRMTVRSGAPGSQTFVRPAPDPNAHVATTSGSTRVALAIEGGKPVVMARINGRGPFPFIFDTGGEAILTADAARALGLTLLGSGVTGGAGEATQSTRYASVDRVSIGAASLDHVPMTVVPLGYAFRERGTGPELAGILGSEFLERFVTRFDYPAGFVELSTRPPAGGSARSVPIRFEETVPLVSASADGTGGTFMIDTGNSGSLVLLGPFVRAHRFSERYPGGLTDVASGMGGTFGQVRHRLKTLTFAGVELHDVVTNFVSLQRGALASRTLAGNIGYDVLAQFAETFDYARGRMLVEIPRALPARRPFDRSGLRVQKDAPDAVSILTVYPNSPASESGIERGDAIVVMNGRPVTELAGYQVFDILHGPVGTSLDLAIKRGAELRHVTLVLRELAF